MTGLETGERLQRALEKEGESVTLAKRAVTFRIRSLFPPPSGQGNSSGQEKRV